MTTPCRITVFEKRSAYQAVNPCASARRVRANGAAWGFSGPFYWGSPRAAWRRAQVIAREPGVQQVKVETISGREVGRVYAA